jgi:AAA family ATP:ADP antiporter
VAIARSGTRRSCAPRASGSLRRESVRPRDQCVARERPPEAPIPARPSSPVVDRRHAWAAALTLFGLLSGHTILEVARDALFLSRLPAEQLPATYLMIAAAATIAAQIDARLMRHLDDRRVLAATLALGAIGALVFRALFALDARWVPHAFYVWTGSIATVAIAQFWRLCSEIFTVSSAKRLFAPIGAGGAVGAITGAGIAELAQHWTDPRGLLGIGGAVFALSAVVPPLLLPVPAPSTPRLAIAPERRADIRSGTRRHLRLLLITVALTAITATLVDYAFKSTIDREIPPSELGTFFSRFYLGLNLISLIVQVAIAPQLLRALGVTRALLVLPITLALGAVGALLLGGVSAAIALRGADGGLRQSLHRSAIELLYFPLSSRERKRYKGSVEALGQRSGQAVGSIVILFASVAGLALRELSVLVIALAGAWGLLAVWLRRGYLDLFRDNLRAGVIETSPTVVALDLHSLESLIASLNSDRDEEVLATLEILVDHDRARLVPALLLYHPSRAVVLRTLEILGESGRTDFIAIARRLPRPRRERAPRDRRLRARRSVRRARSARPRDPSAPGPRGAPHAARARGARR